ncbi:hypothetical protein BROUX41_005695 [Berkeleyomyces rouxiae]
MHYVQHQVDNQICHSTVDSSSVYDNLNSKLRPCSPADSGYGSFSFTNPASAPQRASSACIPSTPIDRVGMVLRVPHHILKLQLTSIIGTGAYGVVYLAQAVGSDKRYAVKVLNKFTPEGQPLDQRQTDFQRREIRLHARVQHHPSIVSMHAIVEHADCTYVVMDYCSEGDLFHNIAELGRYNSCNEEARGIFLQLVSAVMHCHSYGIYHRDLKPENVLVTNNGQEVKLADFGLATSSPYSGDYGCGSTFYMSPECLDGWNEQKYDCAANDTWSLGVILVNLMCGRNPWKQASAVDSRYRLFLKNPDFLQGILPITPEFNRILCRIFSRNPQNRASLPEIFTMVENCTKFTIPSVPSNSPSSSKSQSSIASQPSSHCVLPQENECEDEEMYDHDADADDQENLHVESKSNTAIAYRPSCSQSRLCDLETCSEISSFQSESAIAHKDRGALNSQPVLQSRANMFIPRMATAATAEPFVSVVNAEYHPAYSAGYVVMPSPATGQYLPEAVPYNPALQTYQSQCWNNAGMFQPQTQESPLQTVPDYSKLASLHQATAYACPVTPPPEPQQPHQQSRSGWGFPLFNFPFSANQIPVVGVVPHGAISPLNLLAHHC